MTPTDLKIRRRLLGLDQRGLADALGYKSAGTISKFETGAEPIPDWIKGALERLETRLSNKISQKVIDSQKQTI